MDEYRNGKVLPLHSPSRRMALERYQEPAVEPVLSISAAKVIMDDVNERNATKSVYPSTVSVKSSTTKHHSIWDISIDDLVSTSNYTAADCDPRLRYMDDVIEPASWDRMIPKVVHTTGKTRCLSQPFMDNLQQWKLQGHSFFFHDDNAVDKLLQEFWPEFPQLQSMQHCMVSGAAKADLWRYLVLYRYGGIYADMDSAPGDLFFREDNTTTIISSKDDGFFVVERIGVLSQYFIATSPRHPLMFIAVQQVFSRLLETDSIGDQYVPFVTGPGALKNAYIRFMGRTSGGKVTQGIHTSPTNRSITVVGNQRDSDRYIRRESMRPIHKKRGYQLMGMTHFSRAGDSTFNTSCYLHLYHMANL
jgi:Glycosyltransferase sugar-binding region containing DXD motif